MRKYVLAAVLVLVAGGGSSGANALVILPAGSDWQYTLTDPTAENGWNTTTGLGGTAGWLSGPAVFGNCSFDCGDFAFTTLWPADTIQFEDDLWLRTSIDFSGLLLSSIAWDLGVDNGYKLYMNGELVAGDNVTGFTDRWEYGGDFSGVTLIPGINVVALALDDWGGLTAFDMQVTGEPIPEPGTAVLMGLGLLGLAARRKIQDN